MFSDFYLYKYRANSQRSSVDDRNRPVINTDKNGNEYSTYKKYFEVADLDPKHNYKSKAFKKAGTFYKTVEKEIGVIRKFHENRLNAVEKKFKKVQKDLLVKFKDSGYEFFKKPDGGFYQQPEVKSCMAEINKIKDRMNAAIKSKESKFLHEMNKKIGKDGKVVDILKRNDVYLFYGAQEAKLPNPEKYTIRERINSLSSNNDLMNNISSFLKETDEKKKQTLWEKIKEFIRVNLFGEENKNKKDNILEMVLESIKKWLSNDDRKNENKEKLHKDMINKLFVDASNQRVKQELEMEASKSLIKERVAYQTQEAVDAKFKEKEERMRNNINVVKLNEKKQDEMKTANDTERDTLVKGSLKETKKENIEENNKIENQSSLKQENKVEVKEQENEKTINGQQNEEKSDGTVNVNKVSEHKKEEMVEGNNNNEKNYENLKENLKGTTVNNDIDYDEENKTIVNDDDEFFYEVPEEEETVKQNNNNNNQNQQQTNDNSVNNNNLTVQQSTLNFSGIGHTTHISAKITSPKVQQKFGAQSNQI